MEPLFCTLPADPPCWWRVWVAAHKPGTTRNSIPVYAPGKVVDIVQQDMEMMVYINTDPQGMDQWEMPAGSGVIYEVGTEQDPDRR